VKLEVEAKPLGQAFNGQLTTLGSFADTGLTGTPHAVLPEDLVPGTPYHWRMRLRYDPATTPLASRSRWFTRPWRSWSETMLRTPVPALGRTSGLTVAKAGSSVTVSWSAACLQSGQAFGLYEGMLGNFTSHLPVMCGIAATDWTFTPQAGSRYFLVVPHDGVAEGSYGLLGNGTERPPSAAACRPEQRIEACP
jgi:hypothetical protein